MQDVVLPMPGRNVEYPVHLRSEYEAVCQDVLGIPLDAFHHGGFMRLDGAYRAAAVIPKDMSFQILAPDEVNSLGHRLLTSDVDRLYASERSSPALPRFTGRVSSDAAVL